jgi:hypothetical protein
MSKRNFCVLAPILQFLRTQPGADLSDVARATGLPTQQAGQALYRAALRGHVFAINGHRYTYYLTAEERDEAAQGSTPAPKGANTDAVLAAIAAHAGQLGATHAHLMRATGLTARQVSKVLAAMISARRLFSMGCTGMRHYFLTAEARDAGAADFRDTKARAKAEKREARAKASAPKLAVNAAVQIKSTPRNAWGNAPVVVPPHVKVTVCPGYVPRTFRPPEFFRGDYTNEWHQLREVRE